MTNAMKQNSDDASVRASRRYHCDPPNVKGQETGSCLVDGYRKTLRSFPKMTDQYIRCTTFGDLLADMVAEDLHEFATTSCDHEQIALAPNNHRNIPKDMPEPLMELAGQAWLGPTWREPGTAGLRKTGLPTVP